MTSIKVGNNKFDYRLTNLYVKGELKCKLEKT